MPAMIVAPQPRAAEEGLRVLRDGGNAVDAAVTTAFVQGVIDPHMCGIGGSGVMVVYSAAGREVSVIDFYARAGEAVRPEQWEALFVRDAHDRYGYVLEGWVNDAGYQSVGVPGTVAGLEEALRRFGTISWADAVRPAIPYARDGFPVTGNMRGYWVSDHGPDVLPSRERIRATVESARLYTRDGELYEAGEMIRNPDYAATLERLAQAGARDFYEGQIAEVIATDFAANGGFISRQDLAGYRARVGPPVKGRYRGLDLAAAGPPAGGMTLVQLLNYLEGYELRTLAWPSLEAARLRVAAMAWAFSERESHLADPAFVPVPVERLTDKEYAAAARGVRDSPTTTHVCAVDSAGNAVSMTHTLGASSGVVTPGLGFTFNNYLNCFDPRPGRLNSLEPGKTRVTMMVPTLVFEGDRLAVVVGAPGGTRIVGGVLQSLLNLIDHGMAPVEAVSAPRIDYQGETVQAEQRITSDILAGLAAAGYPVNRRPISYDSYFARVQMIQIGRDGLLRGASDPRGDGGVALPA
jgi:gamma-glutamyltranspeptidase/glutathione hydrolase